MHRAGETLGVAGSRISCIYERFGFDADRGWCVPRIRMYPRVRSDSVSPDSVSRRSREPSRPPRYAIQRIVERVPLAAGRNPAEGDVGSAGTPVESPHRRQSPCRTRDSTPLSEEHTLIPTPDFGPAPLARGDAPNRARVGRCFVAQRAPCGARIDRSSDCRSSSHTRRR